MILDGPASGGKGSKGRNQLVCIRGRPVQDPVLTICGARSINRLSHTHFLSLTHTLTHSLALSPSARLSLHLPLYLPHEPLSLDLEKASNHSTLHSPPSFSSLLSSLELSDTRVYEPQIRLLYRQWTCSLYIVLIINSNSTASKANE